MAQEPAGQRPDTAQPAPWTKLFSAFRLAISPSKLLLAAAGILIMAAGWWFLAWAFYGMAGRMPQWKDYQPSADSSQTPVDAWAQFKAARNRWNLLHKLAGDHPLPRDAADEANTLAEFQVIDTIVTASSRPQLVKETDNKYSLQIGEKSLPGFVAYSLSLDDAKDAPRVSTNRPGGVTYEMEDKGKSLVRVEGILFRLNDPNKFEDLSQYREAMKASAKLVAESQNDKAKRAVLDKALLVVNNPSYKPYGYLRLWPWQEYRGPNPYLVVTDPKQREEYSRGFLGVQVPVLLEPLVKLFSPLAYFLNGDAGFYARIYLFLVILWTLATWALFGGAITRIAVVQAARPTERVGFMEAIRFARSRFQSFLSAPFIPLVFVAVITLFIMFLGFLMGATVFIGDIFLAVIFWPLIFLLALVMALVLVGFVGWPLMYATISAEGSDSFDALSRSYSYVFQAVWRYLAYGAVAIAYGAVLVFFVGFMGSLTVYLGKWAVSQTPFLNLMNREPTYFFVHAPKSFGWRDLLLHDSPKKEERPVIRQNGQRATELGVTEAYRNSFSFWNHVGAFFVTVWLVLLFLLVLGFGYSYFWCASSIIYLLMRWQVDETELDEVHLEEEEEPVPEMPMGAAAPATATPAAAPGGFTMVETPALRTGVQGTPGNTPPGEGYSPGSETPTGTPAPDGGPAPPNP